MGRCKLGNICSFDYKHNLLLVLSAITIASMTSVPIIIIVIHHKNVTGFNNFPIIDIILYLLSTTNIFNTLAVYVQK